MGESRTELLNWLNDLLQLNYTKIEQCGTGAVYCQIIDSIYGDVPMFKVKMNSKQEYEYLSNYKVLQVFFKTHGIDKPIPVDRLVKCKMQDNLEFLQWLKKYWDMHYPGGEYDAVGRRKGVAGEPTARATRSPVITTSGTTKASAAPVRRLVPGGSRSTSSVPDAALVALTSQMNEMKVSVEGLEKERDFYFNKLRDIEIIIGARLESEDETMTEDEREKLLSMQAILYSTEDGFEVPDGEEDEGVLDQQQEEEEETF